MLKQHILRFGWRTVNCKPLWLYCPVAPQQDDVRCSTLELCAALEKFEYSPRVSLRQIKERYPDLARRYHPDSGLESDPEKIRRINAAGQILRAYYHGYRFNCSRAEYLEQYLTRVPT